MDAVQSIMQKVAEYIEVTQPQLDKVAEHREMRTKRAGEISAFMVEHGLLSKSAQDEFTNRIAQDESGMASLDVVQKLAELVAPEKYGSASSVQTPIADQMDPWDRMLFPELQAGNSIG